LDPNFFPTVLPPGALRRSVCAAQRHQHGALQQHASNIGLPIVGHSGTYIFVGGDAYQLLYTIGPSSSPAAWLTTPEKTIPKPVYQPLSPTLDVATMSATAAPHSFPIYDSGGDPLGWFNGCEQIFWSQRTLESDKAWLASYHLTDHAHTWFWQLERDERQVTWPQFKIMCHQRFGSLAAVAASVATFVASSSPTPPMSSGTAITLPFTPRATSRRGWLLHDRRRRPSTCRLQHAVSLRVGG
jgi:hypothetical protein